MVLKTLAKQRFNLLIVIALLLIFITTWESGQPPIPGLSPDEEEQEAPDSYIDGAESQHFDEAGKLVYKLDATRAEHLPNSDLTYLTKPHISYYKTTPPWYASSQRGTILPDGDTINLSDNVVLQREERETQLHTSYLTLLANAKIAKTDRAVKLQSIDGETNAVGMQVFLETDRFKLHADVVGRYEQAKSLP